MKLDIGTGAFMATKEARREQIATRPRREREEIRDDGPDLRRALARAAEFSHTTLADMLGVEQIAVYHAWMGRYVCLPSKANDGKACSPRQRLSFFLEVGDVTKLPPAESGEDGVS